MTSLLLASSPLVGPTTLEPLAGELDRLGHTVFTPPAPHDLDEYIRAVSTDLDVAAPTVMVAFSAAGPRAFAVAAMSAPQAIVFLDARLPADGVAPDTEPRFAELLDALPHDSDGNLPPWVTWWGDDVMADLIPDELNRADFIAGCPCVPRSMFSRSIPAPEYAGPCGYVLLSEGYRDQYDVAATRGWPVHRVESATHLSPFVDPVPVAAAVADVAGRLG